MAYNHADIELLAGLNINSSEAEILRAIRILEQRIRKNSEAKITLDASFDSAELQSAIEKLQKLLQSKNLSIDTKNSIKAITQEATAMLEVVDAAKKASDEKLEFADANRRVRESAEATADAIDREYMAMENMEDIDYILSNINMSGRHGQSVFQQFGDTLRNAFYAYTAANLLQDAIHEIVDAGQEGIETVKELNDALTSLRMATGQSYDSVSILLDAYNELGQELGAITVDVSESANEWLRQGHNISDTNELIKDSMMLSKISNLKSAESTKYLTSAMQGYRVAAEDVVRIVDKLSAVDLESATDAGGLAEAMSRTAEGARIAGVSMDRLLGMIATVGEVTQKSMSSIGEAYKTTFSRMRDIKDNKLSIVGEDGEIEDISNVEIVLESLGIKLRDSNLEFRNFQEVLDDVGASWDKYTSVQKAAIAKAFSGTRQQENFLVMMENWDKVVEYTEIAANSAGTAEEKFSYYLESLEAKTNSLKASLENLASVTISNELYASVLDTTKSIVDMTAETGILKGALVGLGTAGAIYTFQHLATYLHNATQEFANLGEAMRITRGANGTITDIQRLVDLTGGLSQSQTRLLLSTNNLTDAQKVAILMNQGLTQEQAEQTISTWGVATAQQGATGATITWNNALRGLWTTLMANPLVLVTAAVTVGVTAFNKYKQAQEEAMRATKKSAEEANELGDKISNLATEYLRLTKEVQTDESAREKLLSVQKDVLEALNLEASSIDELIGKYGSLSNAINQISVDKLKEAQIDLIAGLDVAKEDLLDANEKGFLQDNNIINATGDDSVKAFKELEKAGIITKGSYGSGGGAFVLTGDDETVEGALENYHRLEQALEVLRDSNEFTAEELADNKLYQGLYKRYKEIKDEVEAYETAVDNLNENIIQQNVLMAMQSQELPKNKEEFEKFKDGITKATDLGGDFMGGENDIRNILDNYLSTLPEFKQFYLDLAESQEGIDGTVTSTVNTEYISDSQKKALNEYKDTLEQITKIKEGNSDYSELLITFPKYSWSAYLSGAESLDMALRKIASESLADVKNQFKGMSEIEPLLEELRIALLDTFDIDDFGWSENLGHYDFLSDLLKEVQRGKVFSIDELAHAIGDYDLYGDIKELENGFTIDTDALISLINKYAEEHNESLSKVREALENSGVDPDSVLGKNSYKTLIDTSKNGNKIADSLSEEIDWAAQSVSVLEEKVSDLERTLDNAKGYTAQKEAVKDVIGELGKLKTGYENAADTYEDEFDKMFTEGAIAESGLGEQIRNAIQNGERFDIEAYVGADKEALHEAINEAIDLWNKSEDAKNNALETEVKITGYQIEDLELDADTKSSIRELAETSLDYETRDKYKLGKYGILAKRIEEEYDAKIAIAKANNDVYLVQKLMVEKQQELNDRKEEQLDYEREIEAFEAKVLEYQYEQLQNQIDLNDGNGTLEQYAKQYKLAQQVYKEKEDTYKNEVARLEEIKSQTGENSEAYRIQWEKVRDISLELDEWIKTLKEVSVEILSLPFDELEKAIEGFGDQIEDVEESLNDVNDSIERMDTIISGAQAYIQDQIDAQEELKKPIQEQLEAMQKANDERERALALERAKYELQRAWSQHNVKLYSGREKGFIYTYNQDTVRDAQENLDNLKYEDAVHLLKKQLEYYDEIIEDLQEIKDAWGEVAQNAQDALDIQKALAAIGSDGIMSMNVVAQYEASYTTLLRSQEALEKKIEDLEEKQKSLEDLIAELEKIIESYKDGELTLEQATLGMQNTLFENASILAEAFPDEIISVKIQSIIDEMKDAFGMNDILADAFGRMKGEIDRFAATGWEEDKIQEHVDNIQKIFEDFYTEMAERKGLDIDFTGLIGDISEIEKFLSFAHEVGWESIHFEEEDYQKFWDALLQTNTEFANNAQAAEEAEERVTIATDDIATNVDNNMTEVATSIAGSLETIATALSGAEKTLSDGTSEAGTTIGETCTTATETIQQAIGDITTAINKGTGDQLKDIDTYTDDVELAIDDMCKKLSETVTGSFVDLNTAITTLGQNIASQMADIVRNTIESINAIKKGAETDVEVTATTKNTNQKIRYPFDPTKEQIFHTGLEKGLVGEKNSGDAIKTLGLRKLRPDEIPAVLKVNEAVLTELQQGNILNNMGAAYQAGANSAMQHASAIHNRNAQVSVGDINITCPGVTSQQVMNQIGTELHKHFGNFALDALQISNKR